MAEALGLASSIVALVQLSATVYSATSKFYREAKDAKSKIGALATQTRNLSGVLQSLSLLASSPLFEDAGICIPDFRDTYIESCHTTLHKIKRKLEKAECDISNNSSRKLVTRSLKWPFASQETNDLITELSHHRDVLQLALSSETMSHLLQCLANTTEIARSVDSLKRRVNRKQSLDTRAELNRRRDGIIRFFLKVNPEQPFQDSRSRRQPNTGKWLIEKDETFQSWICSPGSQIWLSGIPGAGKTILCGAVIEELLQKQSTSTAVAYFFCDYRNPESQKPVNILAALAVQLAKQGEAVFEVLESYHGELHPQNRIERPSEIAGMIRVVQSMFEEYDRVYLVIDGLDECGSNVPEVIQSLKQLAAGSQVNVAISSRDEPDIMEELADSSRIEISAQIEDLELYVLAQMESRKRLGSLAVKNPSLHEHICRTLIDGANGMFRWVACQLDYLDSLPNDRRRRQALTQLPPTLFETYDRILDRIIHEDERDQEICRRALHWIGLGYSKIDPWALCEAISFPDDQNIVGNEHLVEPEWISRRCSSLIRLAQHGSDRNHFQLAHFTVKEYLRSIESGSRRSLFRFSEDAAIRDLLSTSFRFLTLPVFDRRPTIVRTELKLMNERNRRHPFYPVATAYMFCHTDSVWEQRINEQLSMLLEEEAMIPYARKLFNREKTGTFMSWVIQFLALSPSGAELSEHRFFRGIGLILTPQFSALHMAAMLALPSICTVLIEGTLVNADVCCQIGTPLHALLAGPRLLSDFDFYYLPSRHFRKDGSPQYPILERPRRCLEILLSHGSDTSLPWGTVSVLQMAMNNSLRMSYDKAWILPLINPSTMVNDDCISDFRNKLDGGDQDQSILDAIFISGSDPHAPSGWARLASLVQTRRMKADPGPEEACYTSNLRARISDEEFFDGIRISIEQKLTDYLRAFVQDARFRLDAYIPCNHDSLIPVLQFAVQEDCFKSVQILLEAGCDPNMTRSSDGWTPLHQCAYNDTNGAAIAELLIKSDAFSSVKDTQGDTCWHVAAFHGNVSVLEVLLHLSGDAAQLLTTTSTTGRTPLACAIHGGSLKSSLMLLDHCGSERQFFLSDQPLLDGAAEIGSKDLFVRLYEKLKEAGWKEAIDSSRPLDHIDLNAAPTFVDFLLSSWTRDGSSIALTNFLMQASDPDTYPSRADFNRVFERLLPPGHVFVDHDSRETPFWEIFCNKVVPYFLQDRYHVFSWDRNDWIGFIFKIAIDHGTLASYEHMTGLPGCRAFFQALLSSKNTLTDSWVSTAVHEVIQAHTLSERLAEQATFEKLLSRAVQGSLITLARELLDHGADVHSASGSLSPLEHACRISDMQMFHMILEHSKPPLIESTGSQGKTPLHWVVSAHGPRDLEKVERLLQLDISIDAVVNDAVGDTALTLACRNDRQEIFALLISMGANILHRAHDGWTVLHAAALTGDIRYIRSLIPKETPRQFWLGVCDSPFTDLERKLRHIEKMTPIHLAACRGNFHFLQHLIQNEIPIEVDATSGLSKRTPLHFACWSGDLDSTELLISCKPNVNARDAFGMLAIEIAAGGGHFQIVKLLLESGSKTPSGKIVGAMVSRLMSTETDVKDAVGCAEITSQLYLENAIIHGDLGFCQELAERGHDMNQKLTSFSYTPLVCALVERQTGIVEWLVSIGVQVSNPATAKLHPSLRCTTTIGAHFFTTAETLHSVMSLAIKQNVSWYGAILGPIHVAILNNNMEALRVIINHIREHEHAYRKMIETETITLPEDIAAWRSRSALSILVNELNHEEALSKKSPWRQRMPPGSPLHWAIRESNIFAVKLLLQSEADVNQVDSLGATPLFLAVSSTNSTGMLRELIQNGASLAEPSRCRLDAMRLAVRFGNLEVVKILAEVDNETLKAVDQLSANNLLHVAGSVEVFQYLVSQGADPFNADNPSSSAVALQMNKPLFREFIFNSGLTSKSTEEATSIAFTTAAVSSNVCVFKRIYHTLSRGVFDTLVNRSKYGMGSPLCLAASTNAAELVRTLISMGAKIDLEGCRYGSPLMAACAWGSLDAVKCLVRSGAALRYVNEEGLLRSAVVLSSRYHNLVTWLLVDRHIDQRKLEYQSAVSPCHQSAWSGPRLFRVALPEYYAHQHFGESQWDYLRRLQDWRESLLGATLAESRRNCGLDFDAELKAESRKRDAQAAHHRLLASLGEE